MFNAKLKERIKILEWEVEYLKKANSFTCEYYTKKVREDFEMLLDKLGMRIVDNPSSRTIEKKAKRK